MKKQVLVIDITCQHSNHGRITLTASKETLDWFINAKLARGCIPFVEDRMEEINMLEEESNEASERGRD